VLIGDELTATGITDGSSHLATVGNQDCVVGLEVHHILLALEVPRWPRERAFDPRVGILLLGILDQAPLMDFRSKDRFDRTFSLVVDELLPDEKAFLDKVKHHTTLKASQSN
jgi:hypothetical protein